MGFLFAEGCLSANLNLGLFRYRKISNAIEEISFATEVAGKVGRFGHVSASCSLAFNAAKGMAHACFR